MPFFVGSWGSLSFLLLAGSIPCCYWRRLVGTICSIVYAFDAIYRFDLVRRLNNSIRFVFGLSPDCCAYNTFSMAGRRFMDDFWNVLWPSLCWVKLTCFVADSCASSLPLFIWLKLDKLFASFLCCAHVKTMGVGRKTMESKLIAAKVGNRSALRAEFALWFSQTSNSNSCVECGACEAVDLIGLIEWSFNLWARGCWSLSDRGILPGSLVTCTWSLSWREGIWNANLETWFISSCDFGSCWSI